jgi:MFS family permease
VNALTHAIADYREASRAFSRAARLYLLAEFLVWTGHGVQSVLFNLYLVEAGFRESFVGQTVSMSGLGLALTALPAGLLAERWGRRRCLMLGALVEGAGLIARSAVLEPGVIVAASFVMGAGQSLFQIAAMPFITEHSTPRERTHLFSTFFAMALLAGVVGSSLGGLCPPALLALPAALRPTHQLAYQIALVTAGLCSLSGWLPLSRLRGLNEVSMKHERESLPKGAARSLAPIALNFFLIGCGAGLVIPFMNLYFADRFACSSAQIGAFFSGAAVLTAFASLLGPALARRFGKLRTAIASQILSLPFLVTLGGEKHLPVAVTAFWLRATLMQAATPLMQNFVMEALPSGLRARSSSLNNLVWNLGWAVSASLAGIVIQHWGFAVPFYLTATLYATAAVTFYLSFRHFREQPTEPRLSEEAKGLVGDGPLAD